MLICLTNTPFAIGQAGNPPTNTIPATLLPARLFSEQTRCRRQSKGWGFLMKTPNMPNSHRANGR